MKVIIINGPNLNLLGKRDVAIYGNISFEDYFSSLKENYSDIKIGDVIETYEEVKTERKL